MSNSTEITATVDPQATGTATLSAGPQPVPDAGPAFFSLYSMLLGGESKWPEAVGAALVFESDAYVLRTLIINSAENKGIAIPFCTAICFGTCYRAGVSQHISR